MTQTLVQVRIDRKLKEQTASIAAALIWAELPKEQKEERVFVLPLDSHGKFLAKPILVSVGHEDGTSAIDARLGVPLLDHLVIGAEGTGDFVSLAERERIECPKRI